MVSEATLALFVLTVGLVVACAVAGVWFAWGKSSRAAWLVVSYWVSGTGALQDFSSLPPPFMLFVAACTGATAAIGFSPIGSRLVETIPVAWLVGYQVFRIPVEWFLDRLYHEGVAPVQMTFEGRNFDIVSGVAALALALYCVRARSFPRKLVLAWSVIGLALLINIVAIAALSAPTPFRVFMNDPANTFVTTPPFVWLPAFLVQAAWFGHLLTFRLCLRR